MNLKRFASSVIYVVLTSQSSFAELICSKDITTEAECAAEADAQGLSQGGEGMSMAGDWDAKGCFQFGANHFYSGMAFYGTGGSESEVTSALSDPYIRLKGDCID
jgi:hypothetical protein